MEKTFETVARFENALDAEIARGRLESEGIIGFVRDATVVGMNWTLSNAVGGVRLVVQSDDLLRAREVLALPVPDTVANDDEGWGACPRCGSRKLELRLDRRVTNITWLLFGIPLLFPRRRYACRACGEVSTSPMP